MALGLVTFVVLSVLGLLSIGINSNRISMEETRGAFILTLLEADLRNSFPNNTATSTIYGLPTPYALDKDDKRILNPAIQAGTFQSIGLDASERPASLTGTGANRPQYQASIVYIRVPAASHLEAIQARLIVNWPGKKVADPRVLTTPSSVSGYVESYVTFPAP